MYFLCLGEDVLRFDGKKNALRRFDAETFRWIVSDGAPIAVGAFRKTVLTYAAQIDQDFEVDTLEGLHTGRAGDYLAVGPAGEMYPIAKEIFDESYEEADA